MHPSLLVIIERFRKAQDQGVKLIVEFLGPAFGVWLPTNPSEWVSICSETGLYDLRSIHGMGVYAHGYGIELQIGRVSIDFDWGDAGEPDGFDTWRLWTFARHNIDPDVPLPARAQVDAWIEEAMAAGELIRDSRLCYSSADRANHPWHASS